jgi:mono/diheme cytochrome c family protein
MTTDVRPFSRRRAILPLFFAAALSPAAATLLAPTTAKADTPASASDGDLVAKGKYLTAMGDCQACHTAPNGTPFAGGLYMDTPFGKISTPNITPDKDTGIGDYTDAQFLRVFHAGIGKKGEYLYPVMPFPWYTKVTDDDVKAIKAYLFSLQPVHAPRKPMEISFPFNIRAGLGAWDAIFLKQGVFQPDPKQSAEINRGAYIVEGLEHCGECHDSRNMLGAGAIAKPLQGGEIDHWYAPNITSDVRTGIGRFSDDQLFSYLKTGTAPGMGTVVGPMSQTQHESLAKLTDSDIHAIVAYLKSTPPKADFAPAVPQGVSQASMPGAEPYLNHCASCHQLNGEGINGVIPSLVGNGVVKSGGPESVIRVILGGVEAQGTYGPMPAVGLGMTDQEVADVTNYVRAAWGNDAPATSGAGEAGNLRQRTQTYLSGTLPCPKVVQPGLAQAVGDPSVQTIMQGTSAENILQNVNQLIAKVKAADPKAAQADIVNSLTIAYCPIAEAKSSLNKEQQLQQLNEFGERVYTQLSQKGSD